MDDIKNLLLGESNELRNRYMHVRWIPKQDIEAQKQDIHSIEQDIEIPNTVSSKTKQHIQKIFEEYGYERFFGRSEVFV